MDATPHESPLVDPGLALRVFDEAPDGIAVVARDGRFVEVNARLCEIVGRTRTELLEMTVAELVVPQERERLSAAMLEGNAENAEWRVRHGLGGEAVVDISARLLGDGHWLAFARDVTWRRFSEDARRRSAEAHEAERLWLKTVLDTVPLGVLLFEPGGRLAFNRRAEELLGVTLSSTGGSAQYSGRILFPSGTPVPADQMISARVLRTGETISAVEMLIEHSDGSRVPVLGSAAPIRDAKGAVIGGIGVFQDVSEQLRIKEAIRANERLLDGIFELLPVGLWVADRDGRIVRGNAAGQRIWGGARYVGPSEFHQYRAWWVDTGEPIAAEDWALARALAHGEISLGELLRIQCFDDSFKTIINSALPLHDEHGQFVGAVVVNEDVTGLHEIEESLRRAVGSRDEILRVVSHDLRSPLHSIVLGTQAIKGQAAAGATAEIGKTADRILRVCQRMAKLTEDLLDVASMDAGRLSLHLTTLDLDVLVRESIEMHKAHATSVGVSLTTDASAGWSIRADHDRLLQALSNLVGNALKFTPAGGLVSLHVADDGDAVRVSVVDSGPGIPADQLARVFDPFWQSKPTDRRGRGLGLAITKGIVEAHGGRIWLESELGRGTTFSFTVPKVPPPP